MVASRASTTFRLQWQEVGSNLRRVNDMLDQSPACRRNHPRRALVQNPEVAFVCNMDKVGVVSQGNSRSDVSRVRGTSDCKGRLGLKHERWAAILDLVEQGRL